MKGSYILIIRLDKDAEIQIGSRGLLKFRKGYYAYAGSALNGLEARISRHIRKEKKLHWHIDYLLQKAVVEKALCWESPERLECKIADALSRKYEGVPGFGCSDCKCKTHLYRIGDGPAVELPSGLSGYREIKGGL